MHPSSERGQTPVELEVTNRTSFTVNVFWMDYKGREVYKGSMGRGQMWTQTTYIGHPWVFRIGTEEGSGGFVDDGDEETVLLKYVPFRVIPSIKGAETMHHQDDRFRGTVVGLQRFTLKDVPEGFGIVVDGRKWKPACVVDDVVLPEPPLIPMNSIASNPFRLEYYGKFVRKE
jgi:hypothetical protein